MAVLPILGDLIQLRIEVVFWALSQFGEDVAVAIYVISLYCWLRYTSSIY